MIKKLTLDEIKKIELEMLKVLKSICANNNLSLYLCGGTLLGAVRHKGFIPWDDDIDVCMPRDDYMRFISIIEKTLPKEYGIFAYELGNASYPFAKMYDKRTIVEQKYTTDDTLRNIWIDILPVDGLPDDERAVKKIYKKVAFYRKMLMMSFAKPHEGTTFFRRIIKTVLVPMFKLVDPKYWCKKIVRESTKYKFVDSSCVGIVTWGLYGASEKMIKEAFCNNTKVSFEGDEFDAMSCWDSYLERLYGDYMEIPPASKRNNHQINAWLEVM